MENRDPRIERLVSVLRLNTRIVQVLPFAYLLLLAIYLLVERSLPVWALRLADNLLNVPVIAVFIFLVLGKLLKLCAWFRTACLLPLSVKAECWIDSFVFTFTQREVVILNTLFGVLFLSFVVVSFYHFFHEKNTI